MTLSVNDSSQWDLSQGHLGMLAISRYKERHCSPLSFYSSCVHDGCTSLGIEGTLDITIEFRENWEGGG